MTLSFKTQLFGQPTYFMEKILAADLFMKMPLTQEMADAFHHTEFDPKVQESANPKIHTIREDVNDRWKPGKNIHMVIHNRTKKRFQFAPVVPVVSLQRIRIVYERDGADTYADVFIDDHPKITAHWKNCQLYRYDIDIEHLAINDGFSSINEFFEYFDKDFSGKIIHWTEHMYEGRFKIKWVGRATKESDQ